MLEKTCLFISSLLLKRAGVLGGRSPPSPICNEGAPSKRASKAISQGISFAWWRKYLYCFKIEIIAILIATVIAIVIIQKQSVKAEQRRSREAQKLKSKRKAKAEESNQQEKQQAIKAGKSSKRKL